MNNNRYARVKPGHSAKTRIKRIQDALQVAYLELSEMVVHPGTPDYDQLTPKQKEYFYFAFCAAILAADYMKFSGPDDDCGVMAKVLHEQFSKITGGFEPPYRKGKR